MAIDQGISNTTRYSSVPMTPSLYLPNNDWAFIIVINANTLLAPAYTISSGGFNTANSFNMYASNDSTGWRAQVETTGVTWGGGALSVGVNYLAYVTRRNGNIYAGAVELGAPETASEGTGASFSGGVTLTHGTLEIGRRTDGNTARYLSGVWSHMIYSRYKSVTLPQIRQVAVGNIPLAAIPAANSEELHIEGVTAEYASYTDLTGRHKVTRNGTGYGLREEDPLQLKNYRDKRKRQIHRLSFNTWNGDAPGFDADDGTDLMLTKVG